MWEGEKKCNVFRMRSNLTTNQKLKIDTQAITLKKYSLYIVIQNIYNSIQNHQTTREETKEKIGNREELQKQPQTILKQMGVVVFQ